jgi:Tfp pilus assembly protein PilX
MKNTSFFRANDSGVAMTVVLIILVLLVTLSGAVMTLSYNQKKVVSSAGGKRAVGYYRAKAGVVDAFWRIRTNTGTDFTVGANTANYSLDVDGDGTNDTTITIGARSGVTGLRAISSVGNY